MMETRRYCHFDSNEVTAEMAPTLITTPTRIQASGNLPKVIDEYVGQVNTGTPGSALLT